MQRLGKHDDRLFVLNFEFRSLRFIWDLVFGAWNFNALSSNCIGIIRQSFLNSGYWPLVFLRTSIKVLPVTLKLLSSMAVTATSGFSRPLMAMGMLTAL
jgi:hypothetical protein